MIFAFILLVYEGDAAASLFAGADPEVLASGVAVWLHKNVNDNGKPKRLILFLLDTEEMDSAYIYIDTVEKVVTASSEAFIPFAKKLVKIVEKDAKVSGEAG